MSRRLLLTCCLLFVALPATAQTTVPIDVFGAYLHVDPADLASDAVPIDLAALGLAPGYTITLTPAGDWHAGPGDDVQTGSLAVFSNGATLLGPTLADRVPGALDAAVSHFTGGTWPGNQPTDIAYDFYYLAAGITVVIPAGATHLFVTPADIYYRDNSDPDGDFGVTITLVSTVGVPPGRAGASDAALAAFPNPFHGGTAIAFELARGAAVRLTVHDVTGRLVRTLAAGAMPAGSHRVAWDGLDAGGVSLAAGCYFARLDDGSRVRTTRLLLVR